MFKVLIIEDEKNIRTIISKYLKRFDITCIEADNGVAGLSTFLKHKDSIDLVIMDIMMPEMDGNECTKKIREISEVPIIVLTAKNQDEDEIEALENGANDFITKPFNLDVLLLRIKNLTNFQKTSPLELVPEQRAVRKNGN